MVCCPLRLATQASDAKLRAFRRTTTAANHGAGRLNSMHLPVDDAEHQLQVLGDPRSPALMHRNHGTSL